MDTQAFASARSRYDARDYEGAYVALSALAEGGGPFAPGETGQVHHLMGNCLLRLGRPEEAAQAYEEALGDAAYPNLGAVNSNLGMALVSCDRCEESLKYFNAALSDSGYGSPYKAFTGMGQALLKLGHPADAGIAYRRAALDEGNPNPAKALLNLGICFMALGRADDAVEAYGTALEFETRPDARNRICANLGQAYVAAGRNMEAVTAFEQATADGTYRLSPAAQADYARAQSGGLTATQTQADPQAASAAAPVGQDAAEPSTSPALTSSFATNAGPIMPSPDNTGFFTITEEQIAERDRAQVAQGRRTRHTGLKVLVVILVLLAALVGVGAYAYLNGYGYPSSQAVVEQLFADAGTEQARSSWADSVSDSDVSREMAQIEQGSTAQVESVTNTATTATAIVRATLPEGGQVSYEVDLGRSGISWKVTGVTLTYASRTQS